MIPLRPCTQVERPEIEDTDGNRPGGSIDQGEPGPPTGLASCSFISILSVITVASGSVVGTALVFPSLADHTR